MNITKYYIIQRSVERDFLTAWFFDTESSAREWALSGYVTVSPVLTFTYEIPEAEIQAQRELAVKRARLALIEAESKLGTLSLA